MIFKARGLDGAGQPLFLQPFKGFPPGLCATDVPRAEDAIWPLHARNLTTIIFMCSSALLGDSKLHTSALTQLVLAVLGQF